MWVLGKVAGRLAAVLMVPAVVSAQDLPMNFWEDVLARPFPYEGQGVTVDAILTDITRKAGVPVIKAAKFNTTMDLSNPDGTVREALNSVTDSGDVVYWFDGRAVHVEPAAALESRLIGLDGFTFDALQKQIEEVGLDDPQYPLSAGRNAQMVRVVAPKGYADAVAELAAHMAKTRKEGGETPRIIRGRGARPADATE